MEEVLLLTSFFSNRYLRSVTSQINEYDDDDDASASKIQPDKVVRWFQNGDFLRPVFAASRVQHISDMHSKFALRPRHVSKYGRHPISDR